MLTLEELNKGVVYEVRTCQAERRAHKAFLKMRDAEPKASLDTAFAELYDSVYTPDGQARTEYMEPPWAMRMTETNALVHIAFFAMAAAHERGDDPYKAGWEAFVDCIEPVRALVEIIYADRPETPEYLRDIATILRAARIRSRLSLTKAERLRKALPTDRPEQASFIAEILSAAPEASLSLDLSQWKNIGELPTIVSKLIEENGKPAIERQLPTNPATSETLDIPDSKPHPLQMLAIRSEIACFANRTLRKTEQRYVNYMLEHPEMEEEDDAVIGQALEMTANHIYQIRHRLKAKWKAYQKKSENI